MEPEQGREKWDDEQHWSDRVPVGCIWAAVAVAAWMVLVGVVMLIVALIRALL